MSTSDTSKSSPQNPQARSAASGSASAEHPSTQPLKPPKRIARTILAALKGGVVPRIGLGWIAVGRRLEIEALLNDMEVVRDGGASFRFIVGRYGAGKSFLLQTLRTYVMERNENHARRRSARIDSGALDGGAAGGTGRRRRPARNA